MTDIVDRLRERVVDWQEVIDLTTTRGGWMKRHTAMRNTYRDAADEIEMLRAELDREREVSYNLEQEVERLRESGIPTWRKCDLHPDVDGMRMWGCPDCLHELRLENARLRHALQRIADGDVSPAIDFARGVLVEVSDDRE